MSALSVEGTFLVQVADWLVDPMCRGIFAGSSKDLSLRAAFPMLHSWEMKFGSLFMGMLRDKGQ